MRFYLDACCLNRPFDDQSQTRVRLETEAILAILQGAETGQWTLLSSAVIEFELAQISDPLRRTRTQEFLSVAREYVEASEQEIALAENLHHTAGLGAFDSLHLACAESLRADIFFTTDDRLLRGSRRITNVELRFIVVNPLAWLTAFLAGG